ncbi:NAD-dependent epimerase/dehydratase family protein [Devosia sp. Leaf64]|uniref:NAD-dependent epimerase/dehydratase family protein n=1 Tax=Devosia sp. Leaf64 TaxID=1736229 RepID=UPI000713EB28|nr:NAD-dependent epimerase/dehydratase family protein [Devosia sp. Leaf64]KQN74983.1 UDP-glucuronate 5-epimerase [Devosia sp. Leaf64]
MKIFITGTAGFIGFHLAKRLLADGHTVFGLDGMTQYYDVTLKAARLAILQKSNSFSFVEAMLEDYAALETAITDFRPDIVVHLAAQAGVRYSLEAPETYVSANITGTFNLLEVLRKTGIGHLMFASTSSIYGGNETVPFAETDRADFPMSFYAATKKAGEAMTHSYAHLFDLPTTCFRFFTVYGPWGRPDMALFKFVSAISRGEAIDVYGQGKMLRDYTYIDDLVEAITRLMVVKPQKSEAVDMIDGMDSISPVAPWRSVNIGGGQPVGLMSFIETIETVLGKTARKTMLPVQPGDVEHTHAAPALLAALTGYKPETTLDIGVKAFVDWYADCYGPIT